MYETYELLWNIRHQNYMNKNKTELSFEHLRFVVDETALGQVFSEYFSFPCQSSFHQFLYHHNHPGLAQ
jgi:hypothetical protein